MKKLLTSLLVIIMLTIAANAQQASSSDDSGSFNKWQARFRVISVIPSPGDNLDGAEVNISTSVVPELDFTYFLSENWALELILGTTKHDVDVDDELDLGHVWLLPPTLNLQYHFTGGDAKPYLGAGINYTIFYGIDEGDVVDMDYDNAVGFSMQAGLDYNLNDKWFLNLDIKKLLLKTDVTVDAGEAIIPVEVDINPLIIGVGVGMKF
ncbi:MAG: OmpW family outer membrane protein [Flavobacteriaceae bacterium]|jgi:outer membrane protein|nr:OmpW family protein [Flavobacteriaceae bacterium]